MSMDSFKLQQWNVWFILVCMTVWLHDRILMMIDGLLLILLHPLCFFLA